MSDHCSLCRQRPAFDQFTLLIYAPSPVMADKFAVILKSLQVPVTITGEMLYVPPMSGRTEAMRQLATQLDEHERLSVRLAHGDLFSIFQAENLDAFLKRSETDWFDDALAKDQYTFFFQPIVDVSRSTVFAHECLVRLTRERLYNGGEIMSAMLARGAVHRFDSYCRQKAISQGAQQHQPGTKLFINFQPSSIYDPEYCLRSTLAALARTTLRPQDVVFEVVETEEIRNLPKLRTISEFYRSKQFGFALDDVGSGSNSLDVASQLLPDYFKLDKSLVAGLQSGATLPQVMTALRVAADHGVKIIAEGVETAETKRRLEDLGISLMQGYYFGRPSPTMVSTNSGLSALAEALEVSPAHCPEPVR